MPQVSTNFFVDANFSTKKFVDQWIHPFFFGQCFIFIAAGRCTFVRMQTDSPGQDPTPPGCFRLEDLEVFQSCEHRVLADVNYYLWLNRGSADSAPMRFLYCLELVFEEIPPLLLSSGDDSEGIVALAPEALIKTAQRLQTLHRQVSIQRVSAGAFPLWQPAVGQPLEGIRLSRHESGLYLNDALLLDFGERQIVVQVGLNDGLELGVYT